MSKRMWIILAVGWILMGFYVTWVLVSASSQPKPSPQEIDDNQILTIPASLKPSWGDPEHRKEKEDRELQIAKKLANSEERGGLTCTLKFVPNATNPKDHDLEVQIQNSTDKPCVMELEGRLRDQINFVLYDPNGRPLRSFNPASLRSDLPQETRVTVETGKVETFTFGIIWAELYLCEGFPRGDYSLQAVFTNTIYLGLIDREEEGLIVRSNRITLRIK